MSGSLRRALGFGSQSGGRDPGATTRPNGPNGASGSDSGSASRGRGGRGATTALIDLTADGPDDVDPEDGEGEEQAVGRRRWPFRLGIGLVLTLLIAAVYVVGFSPVLALRSVVVTGSGAASLSDPVRSAVGIPDGTPLALVDMGDVRDRVAAVGPVASVTVERQWPHTLVISVTARVAVAVSQANGRWWLLDATGKPYQPVSEPPERLMKLELSTLAQGDRATLAALGVLGSLPPALRSSVSSIAAPSAYTITLNLRDGRSVLWGADADTELKIAVLPAVLTRPGHVFDISDPTLVTVR
jgi:cell division protein FtsQ